MFKFLTLASETADHMGISTEWVLGSLGAVGLSVIAAAKWMAKQSDKQSVELRKEQDKSEQRYADLIIVLNKSVSDERERTERTMKALIESSEAMRGMCAEFAVLTDMIRDCNRG